MTHIKVLSQKKILSADLFEVHELKVEGKNHTSFHRVAFRDPVSVIFPISQDGKIYLIEQYRYLLKKNTLEAVAGFVDEGEDALQAAKRELKEETGIEAKFFKQLTTIELSASVFNAQAHLFLAQDLSFGEANNQGNEDIKMVQLDIEDAVRKVRDGTINTASSTIGIMLIWDKIRENKL